VASIYPLAYATEQVAGPGWEVIDLTPPGSEAHDLELTLEQRAALEEADLVYYLGVIGFQPQLEELLTSSEESDFSGLAVHLGGAKRDPHTWLSPYLYVNFIDAIAEELARMDEEAADGYAARAQALRSEVEALDERYARELSSCRFRTAIVTHEAFGHVADRYGFQQFGLSGVTPEAEPSATRLGRASQLIETGKANAVFYEASGENQKASRTLAADLGVAALPLDTLESRPTRGDYLTALESNLESLREGLQCP
jgi:zinc transport system substrate-binding protein